MKNPLLTSQSLLHVQNLHRTKSNRQDGPQSRCQTWGPKMITFILLFFFFVLSVVLAGVAYSANNRKRADMAEIPRQNIRRQRATRTSTQN